MPYYEYRCLNCRRRFETFLSYKDYGTIPVACPHCGSGKVQRRIGQVRVARSWESRLEDMSDPDSLAGLEDDPRALGKMMRQMSSELGEDMGPEFDEVVSRLEAGDSPEEIEKDMPELSEGPGSGGMDFDDDF